MSSKSKISLKAYEMAKPIVHSYGLDLVECAFVKEGNHTFFRVFIDKRGGIGIDDCELISKVLDPIFDENLEGDYDYFEVSSPGLDRPLKKYEDFVRYEGEEVELKVFSPINGRRKFSGVIVQPAEESFCIADDAQEYTITYQNLASCKRVIHF